MNSLSNFQKFHEKVMFFSHILCVFQIWNKQLMRYNFQGGHF